MLIFAGTRGYLDRIPADRVKEWQEGFLRFVSTQYPQIAQGINNKDTKYDLTDENEALLIKAIEEFYLGWS